MSERLPSTYAVIEQHGADRRTFFKYCTSLAAIMGLEASMAPKVMAAMETKPRIPVIWLHGLECTCCSESFIRSSNPIAQDIVLKMISLDYDDTLQAAAGEQVEEIRKKIMNWRVAWEANLATKASLAVSSAPGGVTICPARSVLPLRSTATALTRVPDGKEVR
jgi:NiFe hydrogenase small subunit HydA